MNKYICLPVRNLFLHNIISAATFFSSFISFDENGAKHCNSAFDFRIKSCGSSISTKNTMKQIIL